MQSRISMSFSMSFFSRWRAKAESSTIRQLSGPVSVTGLLFSLFISFCIAAYLRFGGQSDCGDQILRDPVVRDDLLHVASSDCHFGHAENHAILFIPGDGVPPAALDFADTLGPVVGHPGHSQRHRLAPVLGRDGAEEDF